MLRRSASASLQQISPIGFATIRPAENNNTQLVRDSWRDLWHSIDCLVIGSRYEEATGHVAGVVTGSRIAPNRDGMADVLPGEAFLIQRYAADNFYATCTGKMPALPQLLHRSPPV